MWFGYSLFVCVYRGGGMRLFGWGCFSIGSLRLVPSHVAEDRTSVGV